MAKGSDSGHASSEDIIEITSPEQSKNKVQTKTYKGYGFKKDMSVWTKFNAPLIGEIRFNPIVSFFAILLIWAFVVWCSVQGDRVPFKIWKKWVVDNFTWFYIGSQDLWAIFAVVLYFSKYSKLKLGKPDDKPEYNDVTWFVMLFACGIGVGLFFYGVAEPIYHYTGKNRYTVDPTLPDNTAAQIAINITLYHWGIHGWIVYCLVGLLLGLVSYREGLPMTMKSCFYPLIGDKIFGWMGDLIDTVSILTTLFGVCTSLGLGTRQLNSGFTMINEQIDPEDLTIQVITIWCITAVATISTVSGVGMGIRRLSELCFGVGMFVMVVCFFMDNTFFVLNLFVQSIGYYFQYLCQLGWHTDAFEQLESEERKKYTSGFNDKFVPEGFDAPDGPSDWMDDWTMFYWGWWISWCPFVGMFIAKISRGRTIRQFINGTLTAPVVYSFMWMILFGGIGIKHERLANEKDLCCGALKVDEKVGGNLIKWDEFKNHTIDNELTEKIIKDLDTAWMCNGTCNSCAAQTIARYENYTLGQMSDEFSSLRNDFGSTLGDRSAVKLSCHQVEQMWFDVMRSYPGIGQFLSIFSLFAIILYFVTSSDSGSLVIDCLSSNGDPDPPRVQRVFWALMEGATATALLVAGGKDGLSALQTAGIISGLPYTVLICLLCVATWRCVKVAYGDLDPHGPAFEIGLFDCWFTEPFQKIRMKTSGRLFLKWLANIFIAPITVAKASTRLDNAVASANGEQEEKAWWPLAVATSFFFYGFVVFHFAQLGSQGMWAIAWVMYITYTGIVTSIRIKARDMFKINGNVFEDFFATLFIYPNVALQLEETVEVMVSKDKLGQDVLKKNGDVSAAAVNHGFENGQEGIKKVPLEA